MQETIYQPADAEVSLVLSIRQLMQETLYQTDAEVSLSAADAGVSLSDSG